MSEIIKIQMNRWNGTDYDVILPQAIADYLSTPRKIGNANFDGKADITSTQMGVSKLATESTVTFLSSGWTLNGTTNCYEQSIVCAGLLASDTQKNVDIYPIGNDDAEIQQATDTASSMVNRMCCNVDGVLYARCSSDAPEVDFSVKVVQHR